VSMRKCIYLGPYVECTFKSTTRTEYVYGCTLPECKKHPKKRCPDAEGKFCSTCGTANGKIPIEVEDHPDDAEITDENLFEIKSERNSHLLWLAPNVSRKGDPRPEYDDEGEIHLDLREGEDWADRC
jgi:hypothetical protein